MGKKTFVARLDGWLNLITGLGARGKDKQTAAQAQWHRHDELFFEHLYASDGMAARIAFFFGRNHFVKTGLILESKNQNLIPLFIASMISITCSPTTTP